ncbi:GNAT family N-acetyltransferase [Lentzea flaviverrucosa]|uniref:Predicted N-acyltransferase n=1 Tax=Lentzea flaviverrucosa TaxID=200379 RepID=A0A1H9WUS4_9PSEU|nr:GNAT family N-acetyltransferase [Lentzea flaviverrucosa]RDI23119.1 putative N-acyltransferase [Lentzea flaviverrucosa]SES37585.1 Predicted N-acyltransferase [Lentzea flaviverrucosa]
MSRLDFTVASADGIDDLDPVELDQLAVGSPALYRADLARLEMAQLGRGSDVGYLSARTGDGRCAGLVPWYAVHPPFDESVDPVSLFGSPPDVRQLLLAGSPGRSVNFLAVGADADEPGRLRVVDQLVDELKLAARALGARFILFPHLTAGQTRLLGPLLPGPIASNSQQKAVLPVRWSSFDEYVSWLPHGRRAAVRSERRRFLQSDVVIREHPLDDVTEEMAPLLAQTESRYGRDLTPDQMELYLATIAAFHGDNASVLAVWRGEQPVAFALLIDGGSTWDVRAWGRDYSLPGDDALYFNILFYEPIIRAAERGVGLLDFGTGSLRSKALRGCDLEELTTVLLEVDGG